ncbi:hypothetical protein [Bradyrhizobium cenepequi]
MMPYSPIPPQILAAFHERTELPLSRLAKIMGRDIKTLQRHREAGLLPVHIKGTGLERRHYVCTLNDVVEFYKRTGEAGQFSASPIPPTSLTSKSKVIALTARPKPPMNMRLRSRKRSVLQLDGSSNKPSGQDADQ